MKQVTGKLLHAMPSDVADSFPASEKDLLFSLADVAEEINNFLDELLSYPNLRSRIVSMQAADEVKAYEFAFDIKNTRKIRGDLNNNASLIDEWEKIIWLKPQRKNIIFLRHYKRFADPFNNEVKHIWELVALGKRRA